MDDNLTGKIFLVLKPFNEFNLSIKRMAYVPKDSIVTCLGREVINSEKYDIVLIGSNKFALSVKWALSHSFIVEL
jgi:hypothetical protein